MIRIRKTKSHKLIQKLNKRIFPQDPLELDHISVCWVLYFGDMPVGFATLKPIVNEPNCVFFSRAGLLPVAQGKGLHKRLIKVRTNYCKKEMYKEAITYTLEENLASANSLISCGFKLYEPKHRWADSTSKKAVIYFYMEF